MEKLVRSQIFGNLREKLFSQKAQPEQKSATIALVSACDYVAISFLDCAYINLDLLGYKPGAYGNEGRLIKIFSIFSKWQRRLIEPITLPLITPNELSQRTLVSTQVS